MRIKSSAVFAILATCLVSSLYACDSDEVTSAPPVGSTETSPVTPVDPDASAPQGKPVFAIASMILGAGNTTTTYLSLLDSLDTRPTLTLEGAREFASYATFSPFQGKLIVGNGETPQLTRFAIGEDKSLTEEQTLSFSTYVSGPILALPIIASPTVAYVPFDRTNHVAWNPLDFTLGAPLAISTAIPLDRNGLSAVRGYGHEVSGSLVYQPYYWSDSLYSQYSQTSQIVVIDSAKNEVSAVIDAQCPHLHIAATDENGYIYFSNGSASVGSAVVNAEQPRNCIVRVKAGETTLDPSFAINFRDLAEGREGNNFYPIGNGLALFSAYHAERAPAATAAQINYSADYHLWTYDFATKTTKLMEGIDYSGGQFIAFKVDKRTYVSIPNGDYSSTAIYEILSTGVAEKRFDVTGWAFNLFRVR